MDRDTMNNIIVCCVAFVTAVALLLIVIYFLKDKFCPSSDYAPVKKSVTVPPTPRNTPSQPSSILTRQHQATAYQPGQKTHDVDGLAFIDDKNAPVVVQTVQYSSVHNAAVTTSSS